MVKFRKLMRLAVPHPIMIPLLVALGLGTMTDAFIRGGSQAEQVGLLLVGITLLCVAGFVYWSSSLMHKE